MLDVVLYAAFPYVAVTLAIVVGIYRYFSDRFSYSSFSSQFLEGRQLFWGSVSWHYGIIVVLLAHILAWLLPGAWGAMIADSTRLQTLETIGFAFGVAALVGLVALIGRRFATPRIRAVTSVMDWVLLTVLVAQVALGVYVGLFYRWGADWYLYTAVPWLNSLVTLDPQVQFITGLPLLVQLHFLGGFVLIALFPFTRLVHIVTFPVTYLWRPYQVVVWNRRRQPVGG